MIKRISLFFMTFMVFLSATVDVNAKTASSTTEDFNLVVQQYLLSNDAAQSAVFLKEVLAYPALTISNLEDAIKTGRVYPAKPSTGFLHKSIEVAGFKMSYAMHVPPNYDVKKSYPLIVCLHGAGFVGDSYIDRWQSRLGSDVILVCPTIQGGAWWSPQGENLVLDVMDAVSSEYHVDPEKVFLTGMSNGGIGVYLVGMFHADRFAAIAPMAGGIPNEIFPFLKNFSATGIYIIHGAHDQVMPVRLSQELSAYLEDAEIPHTYREHGKEHPRAGGHFFPREELPALVKWFNGQRRIATPVRIESVRDVNHLAPFYWTQINQISGKVADVQKSLFNNDEVELVKNGSFASLTTEVEGNTVNVESARVGKFTLFFNNRLVDFSKPVRVVVNGKTYFEGRLTESPAFLLEEAKRRGDGVSFYAASVQIDLSKEKH
ncbi:MAG: prolyl oligopeptidase family serine peptidase [Nitrospirae bacterium]|nr:prolyl oligopeptidase family serine peptidase [Candidatus Manganitrophaceae bacterium]